MVNKSRCFEKINEYVKGIKPWTTVVVLISFCFGVFGGAFLGGYVKENIGDWFSRAKTYLGFEQVELPEIVGPQAEPQAESEAEEPQPYLAQTSQEAAVIEVVKNGSPSVTSIIVTKDLAVLEKYYENPFEEFKDFFGDDLPFQFKVPKYREGEKEKRIIGGGTGFIISRDGLVLTNKHVVSDEEAEYTVVTNDGEKYEAQVLARDPFQDLAVLKIESEKTTEQEGKILEKNFSVLKLGDSSTLESGQTVIAIGNALGEFRNTVSVGVISGLGRRITASGGGIVETLEDVIQTDAAINRGNSGGPLLNLKGEVIGVNVAMAEGAQSIGFAIPINKAKKAIAQIKNLGKIVYPFLGIRYVLVSPEIAEEKGLQVDYGALVVRGESAAEPAVLPGSAAEAAGLKEGDLILKLDGEKITQENSLAKIIQEHSPGDKVKLEVLRGEKVLQIEAVLGEKSS